MPTLGALSQNIQDQFFQDLAPENSFFGDVQFDFMVATQYGEIIQAYYEKNYAQNLREEGYGSIDLSPDWLLAEEQKVEKDDRGYFVNLANRPFSYMYDKQTSAIQYILPTDGNLTGQFQRFNIKNLWQLQIKPLTTTVYWFYIPCQIRFEKMKCKPEKVTVYYLPAMGKEIDPNFIIPDGIASMIMKNVLNVMFAAKNGNTIDTTTDGNPNKAPQTELNTANLKGQ